MLQKIIHFSIQNKLIIGLLTAGLIIWGIYSLKKLPIDAVPDITNNQVQVITLSPSLATQEVERLITFPIEQTMATIPEIQQVRSISRFGLSVVTIIFHDDADIYWARQQVSEKLVEAKTSIPPGIGEPEMSPISTGLGEIYQYVVHPKPGYENKFSSAELRTVQDWYVRRQLLGTPGVAEVNSFGGILKQYEVALSPDKLRSFGISIADVFSALERNNQNTGGAYIDKKPNAYFIRSEGLITDTSSIEQIVVKTTENGLPVLIRDVAMVRIGSAIRYGALTRNGKGEAVGGIVMMLKGQNSNEVVDRVKKKMTQIEKSLPEGVQVEPFLDRSEFVGRAIHTVTKNLIEGALIVIFVLVLFLGNLRAGIVVASVIPLSMLFAISLMNLFGVSGNLMSLGAIDFGLIVDGAVIIVEATLHHIAAHRKPDHEKLTQSEMDNQVEGSAKRMMSSAAFGQIIILIVYLPILALVGIEGKMFRPMAQAVAFAILGAFIYSLTYVPMMSSLLLSKKVTHKRNFSDKMMDAIQRRYDPLIRGALKRRLAVTIISVGLFIVSVIVFLNLGGEFLPTLEEGDLAVETRLLTGSSLNQTIEKVDQASKLLMQKFPEAKEVIGKIGAAEIPTDPMPMESCDLTIILEKDKSKWKTAHSREELVEKMAAELEKITGVTFGFSQPIQLRFNELISGVRQDVGIKIFGEDLDVLTSLSQKIGKIVNTVQGATDLYLEKATGLPQIVVSIDRAQVARYGLDIQSVNKTISAAFAGETAGIVYEGEKRFDLVVRLQESNRQSIEDVRNIYVSGAKGEQIPLSQLAKIEYKVGPNQIQREDTKRRIIVGFNVRGRDIESVVREIEQKLDKQVKLPPNYYITYGGQFENLKAASARLSIAVPLALALIVLLLFFSFGSLKQAILIFSAIPMATIGGILALVVRGMPFSISAGIGFIALFGVAVLNGIVLIAEFNRLKEGGLHNVFEIALRGTAVRLRPVLMTATVASLGFLPMALATSAGAEVQKPLATVVIGGLLTSTILTLIVLPVLYTYFEKMKGKTKQIPPAGAATVLLLITLLPIKTNAQADRISGTVTSTNVSTVASIPLPQAIDQALSNNPSIRSASLQVQQNQYTRATSVDFGKTELSYQYGQFNSLQKDNNITVRQPIPNPALFAANRRLSNAQIESSRQNLEVTRQELIYQVKSTYYNLLYFTALRKHYAQQDTIFADFLRAAQARYRAGESPLLEQTTAETQLNEIRNQERKNESDISISQRQLQTLLNSSIPYTSDMDSLVLLQYDRYLMESDSSHNPLISYNAQQVEVAKSGLKLEKAKALPDFSVGYFNQTIIGVQNVNGQDIYYGGDKRFQGVQAGIQIPLIYSPYANRIKVARVQTQIAERNYEYFLMSFKGQYQQALQEYLKNNSSVNYYQNSALPNANLIQRQARLAFRGGDIGYIELLQGLRTYRDIQKGYLDAINDANQSIIRLLYLKGNQ